MFKRFTKGIEEKEITLVSKVQQSYKIKANMTVLETNGKSKTAEGSGLVCCYAERQDY